jgi:hypothetical protein
MAVNFKISIHRSSDNIHLKLFGDFDGTSAHQLLNTLKTHCKGVNTIFIHTNCLQQIYPFGCSQFHSHLNTVKNQLMSCVFTGQNANRIAPL